MSDNEFRRRAPSSARGVENEGFEMQEPHNNQVRKSGEIIFSVPKENMQKNKN